MQALGLCLALICSWLPGLSIAADLEPAVVSGLDWLQLQVGGDGRLARETESAAVPIQVRAEAAATLRQLGRTVPAVLSDAVVASSVDQTELKARQALELAGLGRPNAALLDQLDAAQGIDGGVAPWSGYQASVLDTAWAMRALSGRGFAASTAVGWLQARQDVTGAWTAAPRSTIWSTAVVLRALHDAAATNGQAAQMVPGAVSYLVAQRSPDGSWGQSVWATALVYEAIHDFNASSTLRSEVRQFLLAAQSSDGSWGQDPFITAIALRALTLTTSTPSNPTLARLTLAITDSQTGSPLPGASLMLTGASSVNLISDSSGRIDASSLVPGNYSGTLQLDTYTAVLINVTLRAGQITDLGSLQLSRSGGSTATTAKLSGIVTDQSAGGPLAGASVALAGTPLTATTDTLGRYILIDVVPGSYTLNVSKAAYVTAAAAVTVQAGKEYSFSPSLLLESASTGSAAQGCRIYGQVRTASLSPIAGAHIALSGSNSASAFSGADGTFILPGLVSGPTSIAVVASGFDSVTGATTLACNASPAYEFSPRLYASNTSPPNANTASVTFTVVSAATEQALPGITVKATPSGQAQRTIVTDSSGRFTIDNLREALVQIDIAAQGFDPVSVAYQVDLLESKDMGQLRLRPSGTDNLLPDLAILSVRRASAVTDVQSLAVTGAVEATVINSGRAALSRAVELLAFVDRDRDGRFDPAIDTVLGRATLTQLLPINGSAVVSIPVSGSLPFRDAPIHVFVDSGQQVAEVNETNNVKSTADAAQILPVIGTFKPKLKWKWEGVGSPYPEYNQVMMAPVAGRLIDTNGDGKIDQADDPILVFTAFSKSGGTWTTDGVIRVVNGRTGIEIFAIKDSTTPISAVGSLALADLDHDGKPEIIAVTQDYRVVVYRNNGTKWWVSAPVASSDGYAPWGGPAVADLDGDGTPEILFGRSVFSSTGVLKWKASGSYVGSTVTGAARFSFPIVADLDGTGQQNVILGGSVYTSTGALVWQAPRDGFTAVADFDGNGQPSIAVVNSGTLSLYSRTGQLRWTVSLPGGGLGGPPTIADVDGDGIPEIGVAASSAYTVFRRDGTMLWSKNSQDFSSQMTGSTVFDFDGDGSAEVLYADEIRVRAYKGATGQILWEIPNSSGTTHEYPLVVDIDGDGHADLVTVSNDYYLPPNSTLLGHGIRVFQDENNSWVNTRSVWNQHAYSITNVNDDLTIPARSAAAWRESSGRR